MYADYTGRISPADLKAAGVTGVFRYLSWMNYWEGATHDYPNPKIILASEYDTLVRRGIDVVLNWEYDARDWMGGTAAGRVQGAEAVKQAKALGYSAGDPIIGSADFDMTRDEWDYTAKNYAHAFAQAVMTGGYVPAVYGPYDVLTWIHDECPEYLVYWQAGMSPGWSSGRNAGPHPLAHFRQIRHQTIGGVDCDISEVLRPYQGTGNDMALTDAEIQAIADAVWGKALSIPATAGGDSDPDNPGQETHPAGVWLPYSERYGWQASRNNGGTLTDAQYADLKTAVLAQVTPAAIVAELVKLAAQGH